MRVRFTSREGAEDARPDACGAVISITNPNTVWPRLEGWFKVLRIQCHDIDLTKPINASLRADILKRFSPMTEEQALAIVKFVVEMKSAGVERIMVHCEAGISRSAAVAKWIADHYYLPPLGPAVARHNRHVYGLLCEAAERLG